MCDWPGTLIWLQLHRLDWLGCMEGFRIEDWCHLTDLLLVKKPVVAPW